MDALMCDEGSAWDPNPVTKADAASMCAAVRRVLVPFGEFVQISFAQPHFRMKYLNGFEDCENSSEGTVSQCYHWNITQTAFGEAGCLESFIYICKKLD
mmetsp:Transcript_3637/g.4577  ORF Transcript_3637/g.4577 Transcript_3637/m.4577 type:complete len:99 (+) Transcript_3637:2-298(+)